MLEAGQGQRTIPALANVRGVQVLFYFRGTSGVRRIFLFREPKRDQKERGKGRGGKDLISWQKFFEIN